MGSELVILCKYDPLASCGHYIVETFHNFFYGQKLYFTQVNKSFSIVFVRM